MKPQLLSEHMTKKSARTEGMRLRRAGTMCFMGTPKEAGIESKAKYVVYTFGGDK